MMEKLIKHLAQSKILLEEQCSVFSKSNDDAIEALRLQCEEFCKELSGRDKTPKQNKKRWKKLSTITDSRNSEELGHEENIEISAITSQQSNKAGGAKKSAQPSASVESIPSEEQGRIRSIRTAKTQAQHHLKEINVNTKMRRDSDNQVVIKSERISTIAEVNKTVIASENGDVVVEAAAAGKRKSKAEENLSNSAASLNESDQNSKKVKLSSDSVVVLSTREELVELLSDDEPRQNMMPPPALVPAPKKTGRRPRTKKAKAGSSDTTTLSQDNESIVIKTERMSTIQPLGNTTIEHVEISPTVVKTEPETNKSIDSRPNITMESVYEDAKDAMPAKETANPVVQPEEMQTNQADSTYVLEQSPTNTPTSETFMVSESIRQISNETVVLERRSYLISDDEDDIPLNKIQDIQQGPKKKPSAVPVSTKKHFELFNPLLPSPVKKKVEAFEKMHQGSPVAQRVTRTKTRLNSQSENSDENPPPPNRDFASKIGTPLGPSLPYRFNTPTAASSILLVAKKAYHSTSKLMTSSNGLGAIPKSSTSSKSTISRENSVEDLKRGNQLNLLAEEKKKKREEKQRMAQQLRDAKEKERIEQAERATREREEKAQRLLQEKEKLRLELIRKKEKRQQETEQRKKLEEQKRMLRQQQTAAEEENRRRLEVKAHEMAQKEQERVRVIEIARMNAMRKDPNLYKTMTIRHDFEELNTDDSTDDEYDSSVAAKKATPKPDWCQSKNRRQQLIIQSFIKTSAVDQLFSVQPMSPDIRDMFPTIDERYTRRNSSVIWSTPPRYSELPKY